MRAGLIHLLIYSSDPSKDCNCCFVTTFLWVHVLQVFLISCNVSSGMDSVFCIVSTWIPKHVTHVEGGTNFESLTSKPRSCNKIIEIGMNRVL